MADVADLLRRIQALLEEIAAKLTPPAEPAGVPRMAWGARVSASFRASVSWICRGDGKTDFDGLFPYDGAEDDLMTCIAWETGRTFSPSVRNKAGSGATGLIQFMPDTLFLMKRGRAVYDATPKSERIRVGKTYCDELANMTAEGQLNWVYKYFAPFSGRIANLSDMYCAILLPSAVGKPDDYVLFSSGVAYRQNAGLDTNKDNGVTKAEVVAKLYAMRAEGQRPENVA